MIIDGIYALLSDLWVNQLLLIDSIGGEWIVHVYQLVTHMTGGASVAAVVGFAVPLNYLYFLVMAYFAILVVAVPVRFVVVIIEWVRGKGTS